MDLDENKVYVSYSILLDDGSTWKHGEKVYPLRALVKHVNGLKALRDELYANLLAEHIRV